MMMKKALLIVTFVAAGLVTASAQEIGVRFGSFTGNGGVAVDGIFSTGEFSRIHGDVSFGKGIGVDLLWDFIYRPLGSEAFNWYLGVGPSTYIGNDFWLGVSGEIGLEYRFNAPIALGLDWRPTFWVVKNTEFGAGSFGINVRYVFGSN